MKYSLKAFLDIEEQVNGLSQKKGDEIKAKYRKFLNGSPVDFNRLYEDLEQIESDPIREPYSFEGETLKELIRVASELRDFGISIWPNFYTKEKVETLKEVVLRCLNASKKWVQQAPTSYTQEPDPDLGCEHWGHKKMPLSGRTRSFFRNTKRYSSQFSIINELMSDKRLMEVGRRLYSSHTFIVGTLMEELLPANVADYWHIDGILDQYKAMIFLEDAGEDQGPMLFKPTSKRHLQDSLQPMLHTAYAYGREWGSYPYYRTVDSLGIDTVKATGKAGDAVFFDTLHIHSGSICKAGSRLAVNSYLGVSSKKNQILRLLSGGNSL
ncbi:MAG: hypothetical protein HOI70_07620 [Opitutae bacterium]|jgi:hypothetical protein|nr:hypothetical protein [Opitutae bacterium]